ncbi:DUF2147 domain-containing protein [Mucilaginibacter sp. Bleaf8]|uniref:DUF2147 domain-containing protein n=1 Tax=Mucilaginibacter sp. Bleaf8 TaxID=2834430 RepID=UPI001BCCAAE1|nr:DUF2147 domain-containing protein [Mucilaginibacter sp. Bleaf8]MBS7564657.1 DUF2147 domain-containing protein [Mucilaginibacter sp. Bleaf8]
MIKKVSFSILLFSILTATTALAQRADDILGRWVNSSGEGQIQIYKKGSEYFGKLSWIKLPNDEAGKPKTDKKNPDPALRSRPILGLEILKDFTFDDDTYEGGTIYDPKSGKTYSCKMTLDGTRLKMRGYIGVSLLGRTEIWTRVK